MTYNKYMLYLHLDKTEFWIAKQSFHYWHLNLLTVHMSDIWLTYAIASHAVAYWSSISFIRLWLFSVSHTYAVHTSDLLRFIQIMSLSSSAKQNKNLNSADKTSVLHMQCVCCVLTSLLQLVLQFQYFELRM